MFMNRLDFKFCVRMAISTAVLVATSAQSQTMTHAPSKTPPATKQRGLSNPDTSANILFKYQRTKGGDEGSPESTDGLSLQEVELQFTADVDPFMRASALLAIHPEDGTHTHSAIQQPASKISASAEKTYHIEPEEAFIETTSLPIITIKGGKFKTALGRHNSLHTHAYPFIDAPLINQSLLGHEGLNDVGVSGAVLLPIPFFSEITVQGIEGDSEELFNSARSDDGALVGRWRNLFEMGSDATIDLGLSGANGKNSFDDKTSVFGGDLTFKWRPSEGGKYTALIVGLEDLRGNLKGKLIDPKMSGDVLYIQFQMAQQWWVQARTQTFNMAAGPDDELENVASMYSGLVGFFPSEFSAFRLQYDRMTIKDEDKPTQRLTLQMNISIGAHPAHSY